MTDYKKYTKKRINERKRKKEAKEQFERVLREFAYCVLNRSKKKGVD